VLGSAATQYETRQHSLDAFRSFDGCLRRLRLGHSGADAEIELELEFRRGAKDGPKEVPEIGLCGAPASFGDIRSNGDCRSAKLPRKIVSLAGWESQCHRIDVQGELASQLIDFQPAMILHPPS
jgi:hypothetical protein